MTSSENECRGKSFAFYLVDTAGHQTTKGEGLLVVSTLKAQEVETQFHLQNIVQCMAI